MAKQLGWDFFIPEDLTIFTFTNNIETYLNEYLNIKLDNNGYIIPIDFEILINNEYKIFNILILKNKNIENKFTIKIIEKPNNILQFFINNVNISDDILEKLMQTPINKIIIHPGSKILIPSGIYVKLPKNIFLIAENKSGISSKRGLIKGAQVIDVDYQGEIHINLINPTKYNVSIYPGEKIIQFVPIFQPNMKKIKEYDSLNKLYKNTKSIRGNKGFGSSGNK